jgi:hypothetical protein
MRVEPSPEDPEAITEALFALRNGGPDAMDRLVPLVYERLRRIAHLQLRAEPVGHTFSTTVLVHEAYLKLVDQTRAEWQDRGHFFAVASGAMRAFWWTTRAGTRCAPGRGDDGAPVRPIRWTTPKFRRPSALTRWSRWMRRWSGSVRLDERQARVVECRFFGGLSEAETATALGSLAAHRRARVGHREGLALSGAPT